MNKMSHKYIEINSDSDFERLYNDNKNGILVLNFSASWCGPCKSFIPKLEKLANEYEGRVVFMKIDVDKCSRSSSKYKISSIPTFYFVKNGQVIGTSTGTSESKVREYITQML